MGTVFDVFPKDQISEVDGENRRGLFGQIDFWDSCLRYFAGRKKPDIRKTIIHEWIHMWVDWIRTETLSPTEQDIDQLADLLYVFFEENQLWNDKAWRRVIPTEKDHG